MAKKRYTTYLDERHIETLREIYEDTGLHATHLIGIALDRFFIEIRRQSEPIVPPVGMEFLRSKGREQGGVMADYRDLCASCVVKPACEVEDADQ